MKKRKLLLLLSSVSLFLFILTSCGKKDAETTADNSNAMPLSEAQLAGLKVDTVKLMNEVSVLKLNGIVSFNEDEVANVFPLVSGHVTSVNVSMGDHVTKNQILATVRSGDVSTYQNQYNVAAANVQMTKKNLDIAQELYKTNVYSEKDLISAQNDYKAASANLDVASQYLKVFGTTAG
ncbi:MAG TPA: efflux RND transporter periplasmic adaptor subunit, partial [Bacteroidia bacterium]|nr:efflux RND transporter periplasmic adaptor subunit [Bacteroidia bacterium]